MFSLFRKKKKESPSSEAQKKNINKSINKYLRKKERVDDRTIHILILGPGGSGKSTLLKQMEKIYGTVDEHKLRNTSHYIKKKGIPGDILVLIKKNLEFRQNHPECSLRSERSEEILQHLYAVFLNKTSILDEELAQEIYELWQDDGIKATFSILRRQRIMDNTPYFLENVLRIAHRNYLATFEDYVKVRRRTTGIIESYFDLYTDSIDLQPNSNNTSFNSEEFPQDVEDLWRFKITDVGGQRSERKKWVKCLSHIHSIIYVMSLAGYDQVLLEDNSTNNLTEAFAVFENTFRNPILQKVELIVFLNKNDLFLERIKIHPFTLFDPTFDPEKANDPEEVISYIKLRLRNQFEKFNQNKNRKLFFHVTSATDTSQIAKIMKIIQLQQIRKFLASAMLS